MGIACIFGDLWSLVPLYLVIRIGNLSVLPGKRGMIQERTEKQEYDKKYKEAQGGKVYLLPDIIFKDTVVVLIVFIILVALAYFVGAPVEERANPNDTPHTPRPEWYSFLVPSY